jgi:hypothetical protein
MQMSLPHLQQQRYRLQPMKAVSRKHASASGQALLLLLLLLLRLIPAMRHLY